MNDTESTHAAMPPAVGARAERVVKPLQAAAWALFATNGNYRMWSTERAEVARLADEAGSPVVPLYVLDADDVAAVNKLRAQKALKAQKDISRCQCDHNEYCQHCWPEDFRPGGLWNGYGA